LLHQFISTAKESVVAVEGDVKRLEETNLDLID